MATIEVMPLTGKYTNFDLSVRDLELGLERQEPRRNRRLEL